jgi:hypothetical protein
MLPPWLGSLGFGGVPPIQNKFDFGELPTIPSIGRMVCGIQVLIEQNANKKTKNAAKALVDALDHEKIDAQIGSSLSWSQGVRRQSF